MSKAFLLEYNGQYAELVVSAHDTKAAASAAASVTKKEHTLVVQEPSDIAQFSGPELAAIYEGVTGNVVNRFRDVETGQKRVLTVIKAAAGIEEEASSEPAKTTERKKTTATKKAPTAKVAAEKKSSRQTVPRTKKIRVLVKDNPRREGTRAFKVYALMKTGMTVAKFLEDGGHMQDLRHDIAKKRVELYD